MAATPERAIWSCDIGQWIPCSDSCQLTTTWMCNIRLKALTLARKCEISRWLTCGADGQVYGRTDGHVRKFGYISSRILKTYLKTDQNIRKGTCGEKKQRGLAVLVGLIVKLSL